MTPGHIVAFLLLGALNVYLGLWLCSYAACWFLFVIDETAEGRNDVRLPWPEEPFRDRLWKLAHVAFLCVIWLLPFFAVFHYTDWPLSERVQSPLLLLFIGTILWLTLPISLLSSLTSAQHWEVFRWTVLRRLLERFSTWMAFCAYTFPLLLGCALVAYLALFGWEELKDAAEASSLPWLPEAVVIWSWAFVLPLTAVMAASALLIYARLVGRLAWMMDFGDEEEEEEERPPPEPKTPSVPLRAHRNMMEPAEPEGPTASDLIPFAEDTEPLAAIPVWPAVQAEPPAVAPLPEQPRPPRRLWVRGIYRFPWYRSVMKVWLFLTVGGFILGALIRWQLQLGN